MFIYHASKLYVTHDISCIIDPTSQVMNHILHVKRPFVTYHKSNLTHNVHESYIIIQSNLEYNTYNKTFFIHHKPYRVINDTLHLHSQKTSQAPPRHYFCFFNRLVSFLITSCNRGCFVPSYPLQHLLGHVNNLLHP